MNPLRSILYYLGFGIKEYQLREDVKNVKLVDFETHKFMCFTGYDRIMRSKYGEYMQMPPVEEQNPRHPMKIYWRR